ncbi:MAG: hypothetical protein HY717_10625 [Planctomycetes bacterium]|nr:hypothetical protein [Planctomycetota bacterium]
MRMRAGRVGGAERTIGLVFITTALLPLALFHLSNPASGDDADSSSSPASVARFEACTLCHQDVKTGGHPLNVPTLAVAVPEGWPLNTAGRLTCVTCHTGCGRDQQPAARTSPEASLLSRAPHGGRMLRSLKSGIDFCGECHGSAIQRPSPIWKHAVFISLIHPASSKTEGGDVDGVTRRCLECHDGVLGSFSEISMTRAPGIGARSASHPIGMVYPPAPKRYSDNSYEPRAALDSNMILSEGRVGCLTCHHLFSKEEKLLVLSNRESRLCFKCHNI